MIEILIGVNVIDPAGYSEYRAKLAPILESHGGSFRVDVQVAAVLRSPSDKPFNRLFTIRFPSATELEAFFSHPDYLAERAKHFEPSVSAMTQLGTYEVVS